MGRHRWVLVITGALAIGLLASVALNCFLFRQCKEFYVQLNGTRLDPLGLSHYSTAPDQQDPASTDRPTVVFFGDSRAASWPAPGLPQFTFVNRGIDGETSV